MIKSLYNNFTEKCLLPIVSCVDLTIILCIFQQIMAICFIFDTVFDSIGLIFKICCENGKIASNFKCFKKQRHSFKRRRLQKC